MIDVLAIRLHQNHKTCSSIGLGIGYSKSIGGGFYHQVKLNNPTDLEKDILANVLMIFDKFYEGDPIRKVTLACGGLAYKDGIQLNIFEHFEEVEEQEKINQAILEIKDIIRPTLFPEEISILSEQLLDAYYSKDKITLTYYEAGKIKEITHFIKKINPNSKTIELGCKKVLSFNQIIHISS